MPTFTILGCGSSLGVPRIDGNFGNCNQKTRKILEQDAQLFYVLKKKIF